MKSKKYNDYFLIKNNINYLIQQVNYSNIDFTKHHKIAALKAFNDVLDVHTDEMIDYLINRKRGLGIQNKIFKKYVSNIESNIPFSFKRGKNIIKVKSVFDLGIFSGISKFKSTINNGIILNKTEDIYVGSRSAFYCRPYYIGKVLDIINNDKISIIDKMIDYNFNKIYMEKYLSNIMVTVIHLMVPPHYQAGGMSYINRARKQISNCILSYVNKYT
jgi:hypothetical protein